VPAFLGSLSAGHASNLSAMQAVAGMTGTVDLAGLVLAGGRSRRMGCDKARLCVGGELLLVRQVRLMRETGVGECWVSVAEGKRAAYPEIREDVRWVEDAIAEAGPMEGIRQVLERTTAGWLLVLAVDLPALEVGFLRELGGHCAEGRGVVPVTLRGREPLCAVLPVAVARAEVSGWKATEEWSPRRLVDAGVRGGWMREWALEISLEPQLANWNAPGEWEWAARRDSSGN
jgi:molybdopterin-guanine dinucleotide biosynthesis protein A